MSLIPIWSHTFVETDESEIFSSVILLFKLIEEKFIVFCIFIVFL